MAEEKKPIFTPFVMLLSGLGIGAFLAYRLTSEKWAGRKWEGKVLRVGDKVRRKGAGAKSTEVVGISLVHPPDKYGEFVDELPWALVEEDYAVVDMDDGTWARGSKLKRPKEAAYKREWNPLDGGLKELLLGGS